MNNHSLSLKEPVILKHRRDMKENKEATRKSALNKERDVVSKRIHLDTIIIVPQLERERPEEFYTEERIKKQIQILYMN